MDLVAAVGLGGGSGRRGEGVVVDGVEDVGMLLTLYNLAHWEFLIILRGFLFSRSLIW